MRFISHRGLVDGPDTRENHPSQIDFAIQLGFEVEVDLWTKGNELWLGHDRPMFQTSAMWLLDRHKVLLCHAKTPATAARLERMGMQFFGHNYDAFVVSNVGDVILHPKAKQVDECIIMLPEKRKPGEDYTGAAGICSDYIALYTEMYA